MNDINNEEFDDMVNTMTYLDNEINRLLKNTSDCLQLIKILQVENENLKEYSRENKYLKLRNKDMEVRIQELLEERDREIHRRLTDY